MRGAGALERRALHPPAEPCLDTRLGAALAHRRLELGVSGREPLGRLGHEHEQRRVGEDDGPHEGAMALGEIERDERAEALAAHHRHPGIQRGEDCGGILRLLLDRRAAIGLRSAARAVAAAVVGDHAGLAGQRLRHRRHRLGVRGEAVDEQYRRPRAVLDHVERDARALDARCHG